LEESQKEYRTNYGVILNKGRRDLEHDIFFLKWFLLQDRELSTKEITVELNKRKIPTSSWYYFLLLSHENRVVTASFIVEEYERENSKENVDEEKVTQVKQTYNNEKQKLKENYEMQIQEFNDKYTEEERKEIKEKLKLAKSTGIPKSKDELKQHEELVKKIKTEENVRLYLEGKSKISNDYITSKNVLLKNYQQDLEKVLANKRNIEKIHIYNTILKFYRTEQQQKKIVVDDPFAQTFINEVQDLMVSDDARVYGDKEIDENDDALGEFEEDEVDEKVQQPQIRLKTPNELIDEFISTSIIRSNAGKIYFSKMEENYKKWTKQKYPSIAVGSLSLVSVVAKLGEEPNLVLDPETNTDQYEFVGYAMRKIDDIEKSELIKSLAQKGIESYVSLYDKKNETYLNFNYAAMRMEKLSDVLELIEKAKATQINERFLQEYLDIWKKYYNLEERKINLIAFTRNFLIQKSVLLRNPLLKNPFKRKRRLELLNKKGNIEKRFVARLPKYLSKSSKDCMLWITTKPWLNKPFDYILIGEAYGNKKEELHPDVASLFSVYVSTIEQNGVTIHLYKPSNYYNYTLCRLNTDEKKFPQCDVRKNTMNFTLTPSSDSVPQDVHIYTVLVKEDKVRDEKTRAINIVKNFYIMDKEDYDKECQWWLEKKYSTPVILMQLKNARIDTNTSFYSNLSKYFKNIIYVYIKLRYPIQETSSLKIQAIEKRYNEITNMIYDTLFKQNHSSYFSFVKFIVCFLLPFNRGIFNNEQGTIFKTYDLLLQVKPERLTKEFILKLVSIPNEIKFPEIFLHPDSVTRGELIQRFNKMINEEIDRVLIDIYNASNPTLPQITKTRVLDDSTLMTKTKNIRDYCRAITNVFSKNNIIAWKNLQTDEIKVVELPTDRYFVEFRDLISFLISVFNKYKIFFSFEKSPDKNEKGEEFYTNRITIINKSIHSIQFLYSFEDLEEKYREKQNALTPLGFTNVNTVEEIINPDQQIMADKEPTMFIQSRQFNKENLNIPSNRMISVFTTEGQVVCIDMQEIFKKKMERVYKNQYHNDDYEFFLDYSYDPVYVSPEIVDIVSDVIIDVWKIQKTPFIKENYVEYSFISDDNTPIAVKFSFSELYNLKQDRIQQRTDLSLDYFIEKEIVVNNVNQTDIFILPAVVIDDVYQKVKQHLISVNAPEEADEIKCNSCKGMITEDKAVFKTFEQQVLSDEVDTNLVEFCSSSCFDNYEEKGEDDFEAKLSQDLVEEFIVDKSELNKRLKNNFINEFFTLQLFKSEEDLQTFMSKFSTAKTLEELKEEIKIKIVDII